MADISKFNDGLGHEYDYKDASAREALASAFSDQTSYAVGDYTLYNGKVYVCTTAHTGAWNAQHFSEIKVAHNMTGATAQANGTAGYAPQPLIADKDKYLKGDGTWGTPSGGGSSTLAGLSDVDITSPQGGQILQYDSVNSKWTNTIERLVPVGKEVTPTDNVQIWLHCADIYDKNYTTVAQVLADSTTLLALISSNNAVDYMARSTTWASTVCDDVAAMTMIGSNNYCSRSLLSNNTWLNTIMAAPYSYWNKILNVEVPQMSSNTTPSGTVFATNVLNSTYAEWKAFDWNNNTRYASQSAAQTNVKPKLGYIFTEPIIVNSAYFKQGWTFDFKFNIQASNDGSNWVDLTSEEQVTTADEEKRINFINNTAYTHYSISGTIIEDETIFEANFYGRRP